MVTSVIRGDWIVLPRLVDYTISAYNGFGTAMPRNANHSGAAHEEVVADGRVPGAKSGYEDGAGGYWIHCVAPVNGIVVEQKTGTTQVILDAIGVTTRIGTLVDVGVPN
jgi:hypothetical protein